MADSLQIIVDAYAQFDRIVGRYAKRSNPGAEEYLSPVVDLLRDALPHGSGIDCDWRFDILKNGSIVASNSYHGMDENGFYDGWQDFSVKLFRHTADKLNPLSSGRTQVIYRKGDLDFCVQLTGYRQRKAWAYGIKNYLEDNVHYALKSVHITPTRYEIVDDAGNVLVR